MKGQRTVAAAEALASGGGWRIAHFVLNSEGVTGFEGHGRNKGAIGHFNPEMWRGVGDKTYVAWSPGVRRKSWVTGQCTSLFPQEPHLVHKATATRRDADSLPLPPPSAQRSPERATVAQRTRWLSALTSAQSLAGRAWIPIEPRNHGMGPTALAAVARPWRLSKKRHLAIALESPLLAEAPRLRSKRNAFVK